MLLPRLAGRLSTAVHRPPRTPTPLTRALSANAAPPPPSPPPPPPPSSSVDADEVSKFEEQAKRWWDASGSASPLHRLNPVRIAFIRATIESRRAALSLPPTPTLAPTTILDVGCGGGLVCEPLARLGASVTGIDMAGEAVRVACAHARADPALASLSYERAPVEALVARGAAFDAVLALEVVEHVARPARFLADCAAAVRPGGVLVVSTLNRTAASYALGIVAAERVLGIVPRGTHDWERFVTPDEIAAALEAAGMVCDEVAGVGYDALTGRFALSRSTAVNYMLSASRPL